MFFSPFLHRLFLKIENLTINIAARSNHKCEKKTKKQQRREVKQKITWNFCCCSWVSTNERRDNKNKIHKYFLRWPQSRNNKPVSQPRIQFCRKKKERRKKNSTTEKKSHSKWRQKKERKTKFFRMHFVKSVISYQFCRSGCVDVVCRIGFQKDRAVDILIKLLSRSVCYTCWARHKARRRAVKCNKIIKWSVVQLHEKRKEELAK